MTIIMTVLWVLTEFSSVKARGEKNGCFQPSRWLGYIFQDVGSVEAVCCHQMWVGCFYDSLEFCFFLSASVRFAIL